MNGIFAFHGATRVYRLVSHVVRRRHITGQLKKVPALAKLLFTGVGFYDALLKSLVCFMVSPTWAKKPATVGKKLQFLSQIPHLLKPVRCLRDYHSFFLSAASTPKTRFFLREFES